MLLEERVVHPHLRLAGRALVGEAEVAHRGAVEVDGGPAIEVFVRDPGKILPRELLSLLRPVVRHLIPDPVNNPVEKFVLGKHNYAPRRVSLSAGIVAQAPSSGPGG